MYVFRSVGNNVHKQFCDHIIALNSYSRYFRSGLQQMERHFLGPTFFALQNTTLILLMSPAMIVPENADTESVRPRRSRRL